MLDIVKSLKSLLQLEQIQTDNTVFKLHYKVTVCMLIIFSTVLSGKQYFGEPINCDFNGNGKKDVINQFCWIFGTFIVKEHLGNSHLPGLGITSWREQIENFSIYNRESYYQWISITFFLQALFFYIPRYLWANWEGNRMSSIVEDISGPLVKWSKEKKQTVLSYLVEAGSTHNIYSIRYFFCENLNFFNTLAQMYIMNWFASGQFFSYGFSSAPYKHLSSLNEVFPKLAKCTYYRYGSSGSEETRDALCMLPLNVLNEKIFLVVWYWFIFLIFLSGCGVLYRFIFFAVPSFRVLLLRAFIRKLDSNKAKFIISKLSFGDFFMLYKIGKNINPIMYEELVMGLHEYLLGREGLRDYSKRIGFNV